MKDCIFCKIVAGEIPCHKVWEDEKHLAFLDIYPNTEGFTIVCTKYHLSSDFLALGEGDFQGVMKAAREVSSRLVKALPDVGRMGLMIEGMEVDHFHVKLMPLHGTSYPGFITSLTSERADDEDLAALAERIRG